jgi:hypothetical protein
VFLGGKNDIGFHNAKLTPDEVRELKKLLDQNTTK